MVVKMAVKVMIMMTRDATDQMRDIAVTDIPMVTSRGNAVSRKKKPAEEDRKVKSQEECVGACESELVRAGLVFSHAVINASAASQPPPRCSSQSSEHILDRIKGQRSFGW